MSPTQQVWERLAELLVQQRGRIDSNARRFAESTRLNHRLIYDIEHARRTNYRPAKLAEIENAYRLRTGAITDFLAGNAETLEPDNEAPLAASHAHAFEDEEWDGYLVGEPHLRSGETLRWKRLEPRGGYGRIRYLMTYPDPVTGERNVADHTFSDERTIGFVLQYFRELRQGYRGAGGSS